MIILQKENPLSEWHLLIWNHTSLSARVPKTTEDLESQPPDLTSVPAELWWLACCHFILQGVHSEGEVHLSRSVWQDS